MRTFVKSLAVMGTALLALLPARAEAQEKPKGADSHQSHFEKIKSQKIAYFTDKLALTPEESEKFWPVYNIRDAKCEKARQESRRAMKRLHEAVNSEKSSDTEVKKLADEFFDMQEEETKLTRENYEVYMKVLPAKKAAKVRIVEDQFMRHLIGQLKKEKMQKRVNADN